MKFIKFMDGNHAWGIIGGIVLYTLGCVGLHATTYTWNSSVTSGTWSTLSNWTVTPSVGGPGDLDSVDLSNIATSGTYTFTYDSNATGSIGSLTLVASTGSSTVSETLSLSRNLTIHTGLTLYAANGSGNASVQLAGSSDLTIGSGATFTLGNTTTTASKSNTYLSQGTGYAGNGLILDGTLLVANGSTSLFIPTIATAVTLNSGGVINLDVENSGGDRLTISGNFEAKSGSTLEMTGSSSTGKGASNLYLTGSSIKFESGVTISGFPAGSILFNATSTSTQTISLGTVFVATLRDSVVGTSTSPVATTQILSSTATSPISTGGSVSNAVAKMILYTTNTYTTATVKLGSNLNWVYDTTISSDIPWVFNLNSTSLTGANFAVDLNGFTYDMTTAVGSSSIGFTPVITNGTAGLNTIYINNSGASAGTFRAPKFTLSGADVGIGSGVILEANGKDMTNDLGRISGGSSTINPNSTFYATGSGTTILTSNRSIGKLVVASGTILKFASAIAANGNVTVNSGSVLDLNGNGLSFGANGSVGAGLITSGMNATIQNSSSTTAAITFASSPTAGEIRPGGDSVGAVTLYGNAGRIILNLANSTTYIDVAGSGSNDQILLNGTTTINYSGGTIYLNFLTTTYTSGTIDVFSSFDDITSDGSTPTITSNMAGTFIFNGTTGDITFELIPEPNILWLLLSGAIIFSTICFVRKNKRVTSLS